MNTYRHGDLLIREIKEFPVNLKETKNPVLAYGEATGHHHKLLERVENQFQVLEDGNGGTYLKINQPTDLIHQEHKTLTIEKGLYFVVHEQEYNYFELAVNRVVD